MELRKFSLTLFWQTDLISQNIFGERYFLVFIALTLFSKYFVQAKFLLVKKNLWVILTKYFFSESKSYIFPRSASRNTFSKFYFWVLCQLHENSGRFNKFFYYYKKCTYCSIHSRIFKTWKLLWSGDNIKAGSWQWGEVQLFRSNRPPLVQIKLWNILLSHVELGQEPISGTPLTSRMFPKSYDSYSVAMITEFEISKRIWK